MYRHSLKHTKGFTLIEILIALFIFTIVAVILTSTLHSAFTAQARTEKNAARLTELQIAFTFMSRDFSQVVDRPITNAFNTVESAFIGTNNLVFFTHAGVANPEGMLQRSTLQRVRYRLENNALIRDTWDVLDQSPKTLPYSRVLLNNVTEINFEYLDQNGQLQNRWPPEQSSGTSEGFPRAVKIFINLRDLGTITQVYVVPSQKNPKPF